MFRLPDPTDTIVALATPSGEGAIGVIRLSGSNALAIAGVYFKGLSTSAQSHKALFGKLREPDGTVLDEVLLTPFRAPNSYTREDVVEISCHGSPYVLARALSLLVDAGARLAEPGEFTLRAFRNGALDLSQAEAVADLIAARTRRSQQVAIRQLRGGFSDELKALRDKLMGFTALIELELDFSEEDVAFADREALETTVTDILHRLEILAHSFQAGNALKQGIPTAIVGRPNAGKSTLLNRLLNEQRAIVSPIPGTTRDVIEDRLVLGGFEFRLMDTAGLRATDDPIEAEGVRRTHERVAQALVVLALVDASGASLAEAEAALTELPLHTDALLLRVANKVDMLAQPAQEMWAEVGFLPLSALSGVGVAALEQKLIQHATHLTDFDTIVTSQRHHNALVQAATSLQTVLEGLQTGLTGELLALDIRHALHHLGSITGEVSSDEILGNIFSRFCIGK